MFIFIITASVFSAALAGSVDPQSRIVGGMGTTPGEFPYQVSLQKDKNGTNTHFCAGAIYDANYIITASHCVWDKVNNASIVSVLAGAYNIKEQEASQQRVAVSEIFVHPNYTTMDKAGPYDIAVLKLATPLTLNKFVAPIALNEKGNAPSGACVSTGWGNITPLSSLYYKGSDTLKKVITFILSPILCRASYPLFRVQLNHTICATGVLQGTCQGDSGGPIVCKSGNKPYLAGIVSWGFMYCAALPDVYADVGDLRDFLDKVLNGGANNGAASSSGQNSTSGSGSTGNSGSDPSSTDNENSGSSTNANTGSVRIARQNEESEPSSNDSENEEFESGSNASQNEDSEFNNETENQI